MESGTRYSLFLCDTKIGKVHASDHSNQQDTTPVDIQYLIESAQSQFEFFELALPLLEELSDTQIGQCVEEYWEFMNNPENTVPSFCVEMIWRTHLLHPLAYREDCAALKPGISH